MKIRIIGGTSRAEDQCKSCEHLSRRVNEKGERRVCTYMYEHPELLHDPVYECSDHSHRYQTPLHELEKIAWVLRTEKGGRLMGFTRYSDLSVEEKEKLGECPIE